MHREARELIAESIAAGVTLKVGNGELRYATRNGALPGPLRARLRRLKADLIAELSRPQFRATNRATDTVELPRHLLGWWEELCVNQLLANATHVVWRLRGDSVESRFRAALDAASTRHSLLRARLAWSGGALQLHCDDAHRPPVVTLSAKQHQDPRRSIEQVVWTPFQAGEVFRPFLMPLSATEIICGFVLHHLVADFQGCRILAQELYEHLHGGNDAATRPCEPPLQYSDYLRGLADWLEDAPARYRLDYWREQMRGAPPVSLPDVLEAPAQSIGPLKTVNFRIAPTTRSRLGQIAKSFDVTLPLILLAAKWVALARSLGQSDLVVTMLVSGRDDLALLKLVGNTTDCVPIRLAIRHEAPFAALLGELQDRYALACRYRVQWGVILDTMKSVDASTTAPTFNFVSTAEFESVRSDPPQGSHLELEPLALELPQELGSTSWHASHQMSLFDNGQYLECHVKYLSLKHQETTVGAFVECFRGCLEGICRDPRELIGRLVGPP